MTPGGFNAAEWLVDRHVVEGRGERVAYFHPAGILTYSDLQKEVWRAASALTALGVGPGDRFLMVILDEPAFPAFFLGGLRIGAVPVPVSTMLRADDVAALAADAQATAVIVSEQFGGYLREVARSDEALKGSMIIDTAGSAATSQAAGVPTALLWSETAPPGEIPLAPTTAETVGFWLYTSGTTGRPKGAVHRHGDIRAVADTYARTVLGIGSDDRCYSVAKLFFAFGLGNSLMFPLSVGASAVLDPLPPTPSRVAELAGVHRPSLFFAPPGFCAALVDADVPGDVFGSVRATVTAGETLPAEIYRRFRARFGVEMLDGIGSTEALHIFCSNHPGDVRPGSTGRVVHGYELRIVDESGRDIEEPDVAGALWVRGDSVTTGYWERPEVNAATFVDGWCRTGDVYRRDPEDYYYFVGRNSDMIKAGGIWVSPAEVESVLLEHPSVLEAAVVGGRTDDGLEATIAFVVPAAGCTIDEKSLLSHCRERMAGFKRPRRICVTDALPKTATGKIQRFALRQQLERQAPPPESTGAESQAAQ